MQVLMSALQPGGGIRTFFRYIYSQKCFEDYSFVLFAPDRGVSEYLGAYLPEGRIRVIPAPSESLAFIREGRKLISSGQFQLVHSHGFSAGLLTEIARLGSPLPHLMTAHDVFLSSQFSGVNGKARQWVMARIFNRIPYIHTVTEDARTNLLEFFPSLDERRVKGILHGVDTEFFRDGLPRNLRSEIEVPADASLIGFFGRFMGQKGFRVLVDAMEDIVNNRKLDPLPHVVTFGWGGFIREDYQYLSEKGLGPYFHQADHTDDMAAALKGVDLVAMPSRWEACGLLAMEALAAGTPIIGTECIGLREVIDGSPAQKIAVGDSVHLASAIVYEIINLSARKNEFLDFQDTAVDRFNVIRPATTLAELYNHIVFTSPQTV